MKDKFMEMLNVIFNIVMMFSVVLTIVAIIFLGVPKFMDFVDMYLSSNYVENRAERKVKDLKRQIRIVEYEKEAIELEKKLKNTENKGGSDVYP
jgi:hypothetical protein